MPARLRSRCLSLVIAVLSGMAAASATAQLARTIPADAKRSKLTVLDNTTASVGNQTLRFAPGLRILSTENRLVRPQQLADQTLPVRYKLDLYGQLLTVWVLTDEERRRSEP